MNKRQFLFCLFFASGAGLCLIHAGEIHKLDSMRNLIAGHAPITQINLDKSFQEYLENTFFYCRETKDKPWASWSLSFKNPGLYNMRSFDFGSIQGKYSLSGDQLVLFPPQDMENSVDVMNELGFSNANDGIKFRIDPLYVDFFNQGALIGKSTIWFAHNDSPAGEIYEWNGAQCIKSPKAGSGKERYISLQSNMKMRDRPSLSGNLVHLAWFDDGELTIDDRTIVFKDDIFIIFGVTIKKDTIDGITAPWYLIYEWDYGQRDVGVGGEAFVWVFGGYVEEFGKDRYDHFAQRRNQFLNQNIKKSGLVK